MENGPPTISPVWQLKHQRLRGPKSSTPWSINYNTKGKAISPCNVVCVYYITIQLLFHLEGSRPNGSGISRHDGHDDPSSNSTLRSFFLGDNSHKYHFVVALPETITPPHPSPFYSFFWSLSPPWSRRHLDQVRFLRASEFAEIRYQTWVLKNLKNQLCQRCLQKTQGNLWQLLNRIGILLTHSLCFQTSLTPLSSWPGQYSLCLLIWWDMRVHVQLREAPPPLPAMSMVAAIKKRYTVWTKSK